MTIEERNDIVTQNMNLVHHLAHKMYLSPYAYYSYEDIAQEGMIGLIKAAENFNPELGFAFSTYAVMMIKGYMLRFIRDNQYGMKYTRGDIDAYVKVQRSGKQINELTAENLEELGINKKHLSALVSMTSGMSLDADYSISSDDSVSLLEMIPSKSDELSEEFHESEIDAIKDRVLKKKFSSENHQDIIDEWYYSSLIGMPARQPYLAVKYQMSQAQVSRIIRRFKDSFLEALESSGYEVSDYFKE